MSAAPSATEPIAARASVLSETNPWPGLATYDEASSFFFKGRSREAAELLRLIRLAPLTVLYGNSGLGKSSLLQAGVFPELRKQHFLPVYLRVDFSPSAEKSPLDQVAARLQAELAGAGADAPAPAPDENLWRYLHRSDLELWSRDSFLLTPMLVFDQFEELFSHAADDPARVQQVFDGLADLIENRIPADLADERTARKRYDLLGQRYRIVLSFREDFLPDIESWKDSVPSLLRNRMRLLPMARGDATEAVQDAGAALLAPGMAQRIVDFVAQGAMDGKQRSATVEPVLLSLCCAQLNQRRGGGLIDGTLLDLAGDDILESFYRDALHDFPERVPQFIEEHLVQGARFRGSYPRDEALREGHLTAPELARLTDVHRLLRVDQQSDTARIELIHDRLVSVVRKSRDERLRLAQAAELQHQREQAESEAQGRRAQAERELALQREQAESAAQRQRELREADERAARDRKWRQRLVAVVGLLLAAVLGMVWFAWQADLQSKAARASTREAIAFRLVAVSQAMLAGLQAGNEALAVQQLLAAYRLEPGQLPIVGAMLDAVIGFKLMPTLAAQSDSATSVAFSPDGRRVVAGGADGVLRLFDTASGQTVGAELRGHDGPVTSVAFSPDGRRIASGGRDKTLRLWDAASGQALGTPLAGHGAEVSGVAFSPDGRQLASSSLDKTLRRWDAAQGQPIGAPMVGHEADVFCVAYSPDGSRLVSGSADKTLRLWDAASGQAVGGPLSGHQVGVFSAAFSPDGKRIVSGSADNTVRLWDAATGQPLAGWLARHDHYVSSVAFSPDGRLIASGSWDRTLRLWDARTGQSVGAPLAGHHDNVTGVGFSRDGLRLVSASLDKSLLLWPGAQALPDLLCLKLTHNMSPAQWAARVSPDIPHQIQCPALPQAR